MRIELRYVVRVINFRVCRLEDFAVEEDLAFGVWHRHDVEYALVDWGNTMVVRLCDNGV